MAGMQNWTVAGKSWTALGGNALNVLVYTLSQFQGVIPPQITGSVMGAIAILTAFGVYHAPYTPASGALPPFLPPTAPPPSGPPPAAPRRGLP